MTTARILKLGEERRDGECGAKGQLVTQWYCHHHQPGAPGSQPGP